MFYEFAVDPQLVTLWCNRDGYKGFLDQFGMDAKRIVSRFPKKWQKYVEETFLAVYSNPTFMQQERKTEIIKILMKLTVNRGSKNYIVTDPWLENAEREHVARPFEGIIAGTNPRKSPAVTVWESADDILARLTVFPNSRIVPRTPTELVKPIVPILRCCGQAIFIDPYFDVSPRFLEPFEISLRTLVNERYGNASPNVELHTSTERFFMNNKIRLLKDDKVEASKLFQRFNKDFPAIIPAGLSIRIVVWKEKPRGQQLHNRYLLTDIGSVIFGAGLDCNAESFHKELPQGQTDDIACLSEEAHRTRWNEYLQEPAFEKVDEISVVGIASNGGAWK